MVSYQYKCVDESILLPFLKKYVFKVLHSYIPNGIPANYLTLISIFVIWSCFIHFLRTEFIIDSDIIIAFFSIMIYVIFDHFDGLQAKITSTSSPLGEILDHYSDVFNGSIIIYLLFRILEIELGWIFYLAVWFNLIAFTITYLEQSILKELYFGKIGSLEGIVIILFILLSLLTYPGKDFWLRYDIMNIPINLFLLGGLIIGVLYTVFCSIKRLKFIPISFFIYILTGTILFFVCINLNLSWYMKFLLINLYSADFILKSMKCHLVDNYSPRPDIIIYILFLIIFIEPFPANEYQIHFVIYILFISASILLNFIKIFREFKQFWKWWNIK